MVSRAERTSTEVFITDSPGVRRDCSGCTTAYDLAKRRAEAGSKVLESCSEVVIRNTGYRVNEDDAVRVGAGDDFYSYVDASRDIELLYEQCGSVGLTDDYTDGFQRICGAQQ